MTNGNNLDTKWKYYGNIVERKWKFHDYFEFAIPYYVECRYIECRYTCFYSFQYSYMQFSILHITVSKTKSVKCTITDFTAYRLPERTKSRQLVPANLGDTFTFRPDRKLAPTNSRDYFHSPKSKIFPSHFTSIKNQTRIALRPITAKTREFPNAKFSNSITAKNSVKSCAKTEVAKNGEKRQNCGFGKTTKRRNLTSEKWLRQPKL